MAGLHRAVDDVGLSSVNSSAYIEISTSLLGHRPSSPIATNEAIDLGLDCVEHGYFLTPEVLHKMKEKGVWLVPTIVVSQPTVMPFFQKIGSPDWYLARVASVGKQHWATLQMAIKEGVKIALGTDQFPFEPNDGTTATIREAQYYVQAGMTPLQALRAATIFQPDMLPERSRTNTTAIGGRRSSWGPW